MDQHDPDLTLGEYISTYWAPVMRQRVEPNTASSYEQVARIHLSDDLKALPIRSIRRAQLKRHLANLVATGRLGPSTVARAAQVVRNIFHCAMDDEIVQANPADKLGSSLGLRTYHAEKIRPMEGEQLALFMAVAREKEPQHYIELTILAYTGMRIGELRGLQMEDVNFDRRTILITRQVLEDGTVKGPKGKRGRRKPRTVDMADELARTLEMFIASRREFNLRMRVRSTWLVYPDFSDQPSRGEVSTVTHRLRRAMHRILALANLPKHYTPHSLRHTFATLLLSRGEDLTYVARQLGDTLAMTFELYGRWAKVPARAGGPNLITPGSWNRT